MEDLLMVFAIPPDQEEPNMIRKLFEGRKRNFSRLAKRGYEEDLTDPYFTDTAAYEFTAKEIDTLEDTADELHQLSLAAVNYAVEHDLYEEFAIPSEWWPYIVASWEKRAPHVYGRFDFAYDGHTPPKLLEYNADTPTSLFEAAVLQWDWLEDRKLPDQFNSIHEALVDRWKELALSRNFPERMHFTTSTDFPEDHMTTEYMQMTYEEAMEGQLREAVFIDINDIQTEDNRPISSMHKFYDHKDHPIEALFKLYPWEFAYEDEFGPVFKNDHTLVIEPAWKMLLSNKALLPLLWRLNPHHPNLLPAYLDPAYFEQHDIPYVQKAKLGREGENVTIHHPTYQAHADGDYGMYGYIYQAYTHLPEWNEMYPILGIWMIGDKACGLSIREDHTRITQNTSKFVPHYFI